MECEYADIVTLSHICGGMPQKFVLDYAKERMDVFNDNPTALSMMFKSLDSDSSQKIEWEEFFAMCKANVTIMNLQMGTD